MSFNKATTKFPHYCGNDWELLKLLIVMHGQGQFILWIAILGQMVTWAVVSFEHAMQTYRSCFIRMHAILRNFD